MVASQEVGGKHALQYSHIPQQTLLEVKVAGGPGGGLGTNSSTKGSGTETKELCDPCRDGSFFMPSPLPRARLFKSRLTLIPD